MGELRAALADADGFARAVDAAGAFLFDTPSSSPSKTPAYSRDAEGAQTGTQTGTPVVDVAFLDAVRGPPPRRTKSSASRPDAYRRLLAIGGGVAALLLHVRVGVVPGSPSIPTPCSSRRTIPWCRQGPRPFAAQSCFQRTAVHLA